MFISEVFGLVGIKRVACPSVPCYVGNREGASSARGWGGPRYSCGLFPRGLYLFSLRVVGYGDAGGLRGGESVCEGIRRGGEWIC